MTDLVTHAILDRAFADALGDDAAEEGAWNRACSVPVVTLARALRNGEEVPEDTIAAALLITDVYGTCLPEVMSPRELARRLVDFCGRMHLRPQATLADLGTAKNDLPMTLTTPEKAAEMRERGEIF